jgi:hypothetical protein
MYTNTIYNILWGNVYKINLSIILWMYTQNTIYTIYFGMYTNTIYNILWVYKIQYTIYTEGIQNWNIQYTIYWTSIQNTM